MLINLTIKTSSANFYSFFFTLVLIMFVNYTTYCMLSALWLVIAYKHMDDVTFCPTRRPEICFRIEQLIEGLRKSLGEATIAFVLTKFWQNHNGNLELV